MTGPILVVLFFGSLLVLIVANVPLAFALAFTGLFWGFFLWGADAMYVLAQSTWATMSNFILLAVPLFIIMATMLQRSGVVDGLYRAALVWSGPLRGGLAILTVVIGAILAACSGIAGAGIVTMGIIGLPAMLKHKYDKNIALGSILGGGTLGQLIPPSVLMIIYGAATNVSVGKLFMGGFTLGGLLAFLYIGYIGLRCAFNPRLGPPLPIEERRQATWTVKLKLTREVILPAMLIILVLGSIFAGIATPTEAAGVGAMGAFVCALIHRKVNWKFMKDSSFQAIKITCMVLWIVLGAKIFGVVFSGSGGHRLMEELLMGVGGAWLSFAVMQLIIFVLGMFIDPVAIVMICGPLFSGIAISLGFDPLWFGLIFMVNLQASYLTPPFGYSLYYIKGVAPKGIVLGDIFRSALPFIGLQIIGLLLAVRFPIIALVLPEMMK